MLRYDVHLKRVYNVIQKVQYLFGNKPRKQYTINWDYWINITLKPGVFVTLSLYLLAYLVIAHRSA